MQSQNNETLDLMLLLNQRGIRLYLNGNQLRYSARKGVMTSELRDRVRLHRASLEALLQSVDYDANCLITIQEGARRRVPLFCPHTIHGGVFDYRHLADGLPKDQPVYGFQALSFFCGEALRSSVEDMAAYYADQLARVWPSGPVLLYGASAGGLIALDMARRLFEQGREIGFVALGDTIDPRFYESIPRQHLDRLHWVNFAEAYLPSDCLDIVSYDHPFWQQEEKDRIEHLVRTAKTTARPGRLGAVDYASIEMHQKAFRAYTGAFFTYGIRPIAHRLIFFRASPPKPERHEGILKLCSGEPTVVTMPCNHLEMIRPPGAYRLASHLEGFIKEVVH